MSNIFDFVTEVYFNISFSPLVFCTKTFKETIINSPSHNYRTASHYITIVHIILKPKLVSVCLRCNSHRYKTEKKSNFCPKFSTQSTTLYQSITGPSERNASVTTYTETRLESELLVVFKVVNRFTSLHWQRRHHMMPLYVTKNSTTPFFTGKINEATAFECPLA